MACNIQPYNYMAYNLYLYMACNDGILWFPWFSTFYIFLLTENGMQWWFFMVMFKDDLMESCQFGGKEGPMRSYCIQSFPMTRYFVPIQVGMLPMKPGVLAY